MTYSCSDFTGNLVNHLFANGFITAAVAESNDLELQADSTMEAIRDLMERANAPLVPAASPSINVASKGQARAAQFMSELLDAHETLTDIAESKGARTLADCMYLLSAVQKGTFIEVHHPSESLVIDVIQSLPSADLWMTYIYEVTQ